MTRLPGTTECDFCCLAFLVRGAWTAWKNPCHRSRAYAASRRIQARGAANAAAAAVAKIALIDTGLELHCRVFQVLFATLQ